tara:strand:+ start:1094 stop:1294 length:201 start_codon:yes stop_codon:yes gene_type:complete
MKPEHSELLRKCVAAESALRVGCGSDMENRKETVTGVVRIAAENALRCMMVGEFECAPHTSYDLRV